MGILYAPYVVAVHFDRVVQRRLHLVVAAEGIQPIRQIESDRLDWELLKHAPHYAAHVVFIKCLAVHAQTADAEFLLKLCRRTDGRVRLRLRAVHKHDEGLIYPLQLLDNALLRLKIFFSFYPADAPVGRDDDADGGVLRDDAACALLGSGGHTDLLLEPRRCDKALDAVFKLSRRALDHVPHAVNQPHGQLAAVQRQAHGLLRYEFGFRRHDGSA